MSQQIEITRALITVGRKNSNAYCPVGLAVRKATGRRMKMIGHACGNQSFITLAGDDGIYYAPGSLIQFVYDFDMGRPVEPVVFTLRETFNEPLTISDLAADTTLTQRGTDATRLT